MHAHSTRVQGCVVARDFGEFGVELQTCSAKVWNCKHSVMDRAEPQRSCPSASGPGIRSGSSFPEGGMLGDGRVSMKSRAVPR
jgi:hypothetical protein